MVIFLGVACASVFLFESSLHSIIFCSKNKKCSETSDRLDFTPQFYSSGNRPGEATGSWGSQSRLDAPLPGSSSIYPGSAPLGCISPARTPAPLCLCFPWSQREAHQVARCPGLQGARGSGLPAMRSRPRLGCNLAFSSGPTFRPQQIRGQRGGD